MLLDVICNFSRYFKKFCLRLTGCLIVFMALTNIVRADEKSECFFTLNLDNMRGAGVTKGVISKLKNLENQKFKSKEEFALALDSEIGLIDRLKFKKSILEHVEKICHKKKQEPPEHVPESVVVPYEIGMSVKKRPVSMFHIGEGNDIILIIASVRGNEKTGKPLLDKLKTYLENNVKLLRGRKVFLIPVVNPDGFSSNSSFNANDVDLEGNFPGGPSAPEPETMAVTKVIEKWVRPKRIVNIREFGSIDYDGPGRAIARHMEKYCNLKVDKSGAKPGSLGDYADKKLGIPSITFGLHKNARRLGPQKLWSNYGSALMAAILYPAHPPGDIPRPDKEKKSKHGPDKTRPDKPKPRSLYKKALSYVKRGRPAKAMKILKRVPENDPNYNNARQLLDKLILEENEKEKNNKIAQGLKSFEEGEYQQAIDILAQYKDDETAGKYIHKAYHQIGETFFETQDYLQATDAFSKALEYNSECQECKDRVTDCKDKYCGIHYDNGINFYKDQKLVESVSELKLVRSRCPNYKNVKEIIKVCCEFLNEPQRSEHCPQMR